VIIMFIVGASKVFGWMLTNLRIPQQLAEAFMSADMSPLLFLAIVNVLFLIAGTMVNASSAIVILTPIVLPIAFILLILERLIESWWFDSSFNPWLLIIETLLILPIYLSVLFYEERLTAKGDLRLKIGK